MLAMLEQVLATAAAARFVTGIAVATSEDLPLPAGVVRLPDGGLAWNDGLVHALTTLPIAPQGVVYLAADLPTITPDDIDALIEPCPARGIVIARARDGGTNALALRPPRVIMPSFGAPASADVHARLAEAADVQALIVDRPGLALDMDTPDDLAAALAIEGDQPWRRTIPERHPGG